MTTKKYADEIIKKTKSISNIMIEKMFSDFVLYKNGKRIGVLFNNQLLLISTKNLNALFPNAAQEKSFDWGYYKLVYIETDDLELLIKAIKTTYNDLYFQNDFVCDISSILKAYESYPDTMAKIYTIHTTFLRFCYNKKLLKINPIDKQDRILQMNFLNSDLTEHGTKIFRQLHHKWLVYTDKEDEKSPERIKNVKILEKYYLDLVEK